MYVVAEWSVHLSISREPSTQRRIPSSAVAENVVVPAWKAKVPVQRAEKLFVGTPPPGPPAPQVLLIVASQRLIDRCAAQSPVREVLGEVLPRGACLRWRARARPADLRDCTEAGVVVLDLDVVRPRGQCPRLRVGGGRLVDPLVDEDRAVDPDADAVVGCRGERRAATGEVELPLPADREVVVRDAAARAAEAPVVVDRRLAAADRRCPAHGPVREVLGEELILRAGRGLPGRVVDPTDSAAVEVGVVELAVRAELQIDGAGGVGVERLDVGG